MTSRPRNREADWISKARVLGLSDAGYRLWHLIGLRVREGGPLPDDEETIRALCPGVRAWAQAWAEVHPLLDHVPEGMVSQGEALAEYERRRVRSSKARESVIHRRFRPVRQSNDQSIDQSNDSSNDCSQKSHKCPEVLKSALSVECPGNVRADIRSEHRPLIVPTPAKRPRPAADRAPYDFLGWWAGAYLAALGTPWVGSSRSAVDAAIVRRLLKSLSLAELQARAARFLKTRDPWISQTDRGLAVFAKCLNRPALVTQDGRGKIGGPEAWGAVLEQLERVRNGPRVISPGGYGYTTKPDLAAGVNRALDAIGGFRMLLTAQADAMVSHRARFLEAYGQPA